MTAARAYPPAMSRPLFTARVSPLDPDDLRRRECAQQALADSVRRLVDLTIRTEVPVPELDAVAAAVEALSDRLALRVWDGPLGMQQGSDGRIRNDANPVVGRRNPLAPPLRITAEGDDPAWARASLGAGFEGPPGHVHGGVIALVLDQVLGQAAATAGKRGLTAYLHTTYRRPTPLGTITARARVVEAHEWKTLVRGEILDGQDRVTVEAQGLFVVPRWARTPGALSAGSDIADFPAPTEGDPGDLSPRRAP